MEYRCSGHFYFFPSFSINRFFASDPIEFRSHTIDHALFLILVALKNSKYLYSVEKHTFSSKDLGVDLYKAVK